MAAKGNSLSCSSSKVSCRPKSKSEEEREREGQTALGVSGLGFRAAISDLGPHA